MTAVRTDNAAAADSAGGYTSTALWEKIRYHPARFIFVVYVAFLLACVVAGILYRDQFGFIDERNIALLLRGMPVLGFITLGVGVLMIAGEYRDQFGFIDERNIALLLRGMPVLDLSVGGVYVVAPYVAGTLFHQGEWPLGLAFMVGLAAALIVGLMNGLATVKLNIPSFITTLGMMFLLRGFMRAISGAGASSSVDTKQASLYPGEFVENLLSGSVGVMQAQFLWFIGFAILAYLMLYRNRFGNHLFAVGGNREAAISIGINVGGVKIVAFMLCSFGAAISGILSAVTVNVVVPIQAYVGYEMQAIVACVIGGLFLFGGRGTILGIMFGSALIYTLENALVMMRADGSYHRVFIGAAVIIAVLVNTWMSRTRRLAPPDESSAGAA